MIGFINIYKPTGITSTEVVRKIKKRFNIKKIGHLGTLDPLACGVLGIAVGKATRMFDYFLEYSKTYRAVFSFGYETNTLDSTGQVVNKTDTIPTKNEILNILSTFIGKKNQIPPKFSAKRVDGVRAYNLARQGKDFNLKPKEIEILSFKLLSQINKTDYEFEIECSSGTYIRSIGRDLAYKLNSLATMTFLERTKNGGFTLETTTKLDDYLNNDELNLIAINTVFDKFDSHEVNKKELENIIHGRNNHLQTPFLSPTFLTYKGEILGVAKQNINTLALKINLRGEI